MRANFSVKVRPKEPIGKAFRRFSNKTKRSGLRREMKKRWFYLKPSDQRKLARQRSLRRQRKAEQRRTA